MPAIYLVFSGKLLNCGMMEIPSELTLGEALTKYGGGCPGRKHFKAVRIGGAFGKWLTPEQTDITLDSPEFAALLKDMPELSVHVLDDDHCMGQELVFLLQMAAESCCGKCPVCKDTLKKLNAAAEHIPEGKGGKNAVEKLTALSERLAASASCAICRTAGEGALSLLKGFGDEIAAHVKKGKCPAGVCRELISFTISDKCHGCMMCVGNCPTGAISGEALHKHVIDQSRCIKCGKCVKSCKFRAVTRN